MTVALRQAGLAAEVRELVDAHGEGRRRATFHARFGPDGSRPHVGFMEARAHRIVDIEFCPILAPEMAGAVAAARKLALVLSNAGKPLDILVTGTDAGLDVDLRGLGPASAEQTRDAGQDGRAARPGPPVQSRRGSGRGPHPGAAHGASPNCCCRPAPFCRPRAAAKPSWPDA